MNHVAPSRTTPETHQRQHDKLSKIPVRIEPRPPMPKPPWIRIKPAASDAVQQLKKTLRQQGLHTVCEEAACPNLSECFGHGTATFLILGDLCTRRCPFCDVAHGRPLPPDPAEPERLAATVAAMGLRHVVITSVDRDDLRDGGAGHFAACIEALRMICPETRIEILVPDFRGRQEVALTILAATPCDVFNHNLETVPRLYRSVRPGADYHASLQLLRTHRNLLPHIPVKSGLMLGLGETREEILAVMRDLREHGCTLLTLGQYLAPSRAHLPVERYVTPQEFAELAERAREMDFLHVASAPLVRSSYHAELAWRDVVAIDY